MSANKYLDYLILHAYRKNKKNYFNPSNPNSIIQYEEPTNKNMSQLKIPKLKSCASENSSLKSMLDNWQNKQQSDRIITNIQKSKIRSQDFLSPQVIRQSDVNRKYFLRRSNEETKQFVHKYQNSQDDLIFPLTQQKQIKGHQFKRSERNFDWQKLQIHETSLPPLKQSTEQDEIKESKATLSSLTRHLKDIEIPQINAFDIKLSNFQESDMTKLGQSLLNARFKAKQLQQNINNMQKIYMQRLNNKE